jgi:hypothetical protein
VWWRLRQTWSTVTASNFAHRVNFVLFVSRRLANIKRVLKNNNKGDGSVRNSLDLKTLFIYIYSVFVPILPNPFNGATDLASKYAKFPWGWKLEAFTVLIRFLKTDRGLTSDVLIYWPMYTRCWRRSDPLQIADQNFQIHCKTVIS